MTTARHDVRALLATCGLLAVVACGDDESSEPAPDSGTPASEADAGHTDGHDHGASDAANTPVVDAAPDPSCSATVSLQDYMLVPAEVSVGSGTVVLCARNDGRAQHDLALRGSDQATLGKTVTLNPGESGRFTLTLNAGSYPTFCSLPGHESLGMKGTLTVR